jgi:alkylation response protein AidB-like acyl-CoA dehydrogenase
MQTYLAPLRDMRFLMHELHDTAHLALLPGLEAVSADVLDAVLDEAAKFITNTFLPLNASGDAQGCHYEGGQVSTPKGFKEAYAMFIAGGWGALSSDPAYGGAGLPESVGKFVEEMLCACNLSFALYPGLSHGAYLALKSNGSAALREVYLPKLVDGSWTGTMCLTEAHCGTDLGLLRTRAVPQADGSYRLSGSKIFISAGEHDLAENIIHLVLARLPDAPPGVKGISLFAVPKWLPTANGALGARNGVHCSGIEHKMGIKASATCHISFDEATGWLVGEPHKGMRAMFVMMNSERLSVGIQGLGVGELAYQRAVAYAKERLQGRSPAGAKYPRKAADPLIVHPDVRRMLMTMRAYNEGCRALGVWVANDLDRMDRLEEQLARETAEDFVALMTPVVKALFTDLGFESANLALQVYGGHGYIVEQGMEQLVRDARIAMLYEGTNGIQALDLVSRKLSANGGRAVRHLFERISQYIDAHEQDPAVGVLIRRFLNAFDALKRATVLIVERNAGDPEEAAAAASDYLRLFGLVTLGFMWVQMAVVVNVKLAAANNDNDFYRAKHQTAVFFIERLLPQAQALLSVISAGKASIMAIDDAAW